MKKKTLSNKLFSNDKIWKLIAEMGWELNPDYKTISHNGFEIWGSVIMNRIHDFAADRVAELYGKVSKYEVDNHITLQLGSDDSMNDLLWHVVGCGFSQWAAAMQDPRNLEIRAKANNYKESFAYCFQEPDKEEVKPVIYPLCHKCTHSLFSKMVGTSGQSFKGCREDDRITWENRAQYCPIINP